MLPVENMPIERILAVDDTVDNLVLLQTLLEVEGYKVEMLSDGREAIKYVQNSPPDLILLDVMMPFMDGYDVTRQIRTHKEFDNIPILLLTAFHDVSVAEGLDAGANDFIRKPFDHDELLARVRSLLRLKHSLDAQNEMARAREDFVSRLTHDLRTPLVAADRMLTLFNQEVFCPISDEMKQAITAMSRSNHNLLEMVNTLLEVSRFEAGRKSMNFTSCNLSEIITEVLQELQPLAAEKDLTITVSNQINQDPENPVCVMGDKLELRRVIGNLLGNGIKFTDVGGITISTQEKPNQNQISIAITDTGYGIPPEDLSELFKRFRQGTNKRAGSGLGLHLSQRIMETHGGKIEVVSELGKGSVFTVTIPKASDET